MKREKIPANWAKKPRLQRTIETIQLVRNERGNMACGDFLLHAAVDSLSSDDIGSAKAYLEQFLLIAQNVEPEHRAVVGVVISKILTHKKFKIFGPLLNILNLILDIFKLASRNLLSCKSLGIDIPIKINV
ncbi:MAG: hypothetical protein AB1410_03810 [Acidobacteriota bacterium]